MIFPITKGEFHKYLARNILDGTILNQDSCRTCVLAQAINDVRQQKVFIFSTTWQYRNDIHQVQYPLPQWALEFQMVYDACNPPMHYKLALLILSN